MPLLPAPRLDLDQADRHLVGVETAPHLQPGSSTEVDDGVSDLSDPALAKANPIF